jgi:hypothetical protein
VSSIKFREEIISTQLTSALDPRSDDPKKNGVFLCDNQIAPLLEEGPVAGQIGLTYAAGRECPQALGAYHELTGESF